MLPIYYDYIVCSNSPSFSQGRTRDANEDAKCYSKLIEPKRRVFPYFKKTEIKTSNSIKSTARQLGITNKSSHVARGFSGCLGVYFGSAAKCFEMFTFASYVLQSYYQVTKWNEDNLYSNLTRSSTGEQFVNHTCIVTK